MTDLQIKELFANDQFVAEISGKILPESGYDQPGDEPVYGTTSSPLVVQMLYPSQGADSSHLPKFPRVPGDGGNAYHYGSAFPASTSTTLTSVCSGRQSRRRHRHPGRRPVGFGTSSLAMSLLVTSEARLGAEEPGRPMVIGNAVVQATFCSVLIAEEKTLLLANSTNKLGTTPTPTRTDNGVRWQELCSPATTSAIRGCVDRKGLVEFLELLTAFAS